MAYSDEEKRKVIKDICDWVGKGAFKTHVIEAYDVPPPGTIWEWIKKYPEFAEAIKKAENKIIMRDTVLLQNRAEVAAIIYRLKCRDPKSFNKDKETEVVEKPPSIKIVFEYESSSDGKRNQDKVPPPPGPEAA